MSFDQPTARALDALVLARHNISLIRQWAGRLDYQTLSADIMCSYAIQYAFINLAEAVKDVPLSILEKYNAPFYWRDIADFRNHLAHTYDDKIDHRVMETIHTDIPELDAILGAITTDMESTEQ